MLPRQTNQQVSTALRTLRLQIFQSPLHTAPLHTSAATCRMMWPCLGMLLAAAAIPTSVALDDKYDPVAQHPPVSKPPTNLSRVSACLLPPPHFSISVHPHLSQALLSAANLYMNVSEEAGVCTTHILVTVSARQSSCSLPFHTSFPAYGSLHVHCWAYSTRHHESVCRVWQFGPVGLRLCCSAHNALPLTFPVQSPGGLYTPTLDAVYIEVSRGNSAALAATNHYTSLAVLPATTPHCCATSYRTSLPCYQLLHLIAVLPAITPHCRAVLLRL